jgi:hypothetical protein
LNVGIEIGKGKNYLSKIIKDFESVQYQKQKIYADIQERLNEEQ